MSAPALYHGGVAGLGVGDELTHGPPHVEDGCPICTARAYGGTCTVGQYRAWVANEIWLAGGPAHHPTARKLYESLAGVPDHLPMDAPSETPDLYVSPSLLYARYYAAVRRGDLYRVEPLDELVASPADSFPSYKTTRARVVEVVARRVRLTRRQRREIEREWRKADARKDRATA